jgi:hypothetical protein
MSVRASVVACLAVLGLGLAAPAASGAAADELPQLGGAVAEAECLAAPRAAAPPARAAGSGPTVRGVVRAAARKGAISAEDAERYEAAYEAALRARGRLGGTRRREMAGVIRQLETFARQRTLTVARMPVLFRQLEENTRWWSRNSPPAPPRPSSRPCAGGTGQGGARVVRDEIVFQWYSGQGLQVQQLATAGRANALVKACMEHNPQLACDRERVRTAMDGLVMLGVDRGGYRGWEYYFAFGGGRPPWVSGLAQGTAMQALARGSQVLGDPRYLQAAREGLGVFRRRPPAGVRVSAPGGSHFLIYSFNPGLRVLNGFLQALVGLYDYAEIADDDAARRLFRSGERRARREVPGSDTGAWSRYSAGGAESDLGYHRLVRDFLRSMCERTKVRVYCRTGERFQRYLRERPGLRFLPSGAVRARRAAAARFYVTKVGCVTLTVTRGGARVATVTRVLGRGARSLAWVPPRRGVYRVQVRAEDLAGNVARITTTVRAR